MKYDLVTFLIAVTNYPMKSQLKEESIYCGSSVWLWAIMVQKVQWQMCEAADYITDTVQKQIYECWCSAHFLLPI